VTKVILLKSGILIVCLRCLHCPKD